MIFVIQFEDNENAADQRSKFMQDHLLFLKRNSGTILSAGPLFDAGWGLPSGGMWLVEAETVTDAQTLVNKDPFWPTGLRKTVKILEWRQVFASGQRRDG